MYYTVWCLASTNEGSMSGSKEKFEEMFSEGESKEPEWGKARSLSPSDKDFLDKISEMSREYSLKSILDSASGGRIHGSIKPPRTYKFEPARVTHTHAPSNITEWAERVVSIQKEIKEYRAKVKEINALKREAEAELESLLEKKP